MVLREIKREEYYVCRRFIEFEPMAVTYVYAS